MITTIESEDDLGREVARLVMRNHEHMRISPTNRSASTSEKYSGGIKLCG